MVDYGRSSDLTIQLTGSDRWDQEGSKPVDDIEEWIELVHEIEGASIFDVTMDPLAWKYFKRNKQVLEILDNRRAAGANSAELGGVDLASSAIRRELRDLQGLDLLQYYLDPGHRAAKPLLPKGRSSPSPDSEHQARGDLDDDSLNAMEMWRSRKQDPS